MGSLSIARARRANDIRALEMKRRKAEYNLSQRVPTDTSPDGLRRMQDRLKAIREHIESLNSQITALNALDDAALEARYVPQLSPEVKARIAGTNFTDYLARGPRVTR